MPDPSGSGTCFMAKNDELKALRNQVKHLQRNAGKKVSRLRSKGVNLAGSGVDPRKDPKLIDRYNRTQLKTQLERLGEFNSRKNQYVPGVGGRPIPKVEWDKYKRTEKKFNQNILDIRAKIDNVRLGNSAMTIGQRYEVMVPKTGPSMGGGSMRYFPMSRSSRGVTGPDSIQRLIDDLEKKMEPNYQSEQESRLRDNFDHLLKYSGRDDLRALANELNSEEFAIIWNFSPVVATLAENYHSILAMISDGDAALELSGVEESFDEVKDILEWAVKTKALRGKLIDFELDDKLVKPKRTRESRYVKNPSAIKKDRISAAKRGIARNPGLRDA